jgi:diacylglycerol kinase family enzyme
VSFDPPQRVTPDGEILGTTPLEIEIVPRALEVFSA